MIKIGEFQKLTIKREMPQGFYMEDVDGEEVLMPRAYLTEDMEIGAELEVFVYCDSEDLEIATTEKPMLTVGQFATLQVKDVNKMGAFCDWGVSKELFIPFRNQTFRLEIGDRCVVYLYLDELSDRLVGTTKINAFLQQTADEYFIMGQEVNLMVYAETDLGYRVAINQTHAGLVYKKELYKPLRIGQECKGYIKPLREDEKIDVSVFPIGHQSIEPNAQKIMKRLEVNEGFLPYTDKSNPDLIRREFGISKKLFKKSLGNLYRQKLVLLKKDGIYKV